MSNHPIIKETRNDDSWQHHEIRVGDCFCIGKFQTGASYGESYFCISGTGYASIPLDADTLTKILDDLKYWVHVNHV